MKDKIKEAREIANRIANTSNGDIDVLPSDIATWQDYDVLIWIEDWGFSWDNQNQQWINEE